MTSPAYLEPHGTDIYNGDEPWMHWPRCGLCGDPVAPEDAQPLAGFPGDVFHTTPCAADYCREHDEFDCGEAHDAS